MSHQINLLDPSLAPAHEALGSAAGLAALAASLVAATAITLVLQVLGTRASTQAGTAEQALKALQAQVAAASGVAISGETAELAHLRAIESGQRRIRAALDSGQTGEAQGYSGYLLALSHQSSRTLWLTSFGVAQDGRALDIGGRMTDPAQLPGYLRRLDAEPLFRGRAFAQLSLKAMEPGVAPGDGAAPLAGYVEFALRSGAAASEPH